jgi:hypothetical protein
MSGVQGAAQRAVRLARNYLDFQEPEGRIHDVQAEPRFQHRGVDLLWERPGAPIAGVEVKGDRQARRGNYFLELVSNLERNRPGCFLYSMADILLYVFLGPRELHHLPLRATREWFLPRASSFGQKATQTRVGRSRYTTVGAIVPIRQLLAEVPGAVRFRINTEGQVNRVAERLKR